MFDLRNVLQLVNHGFNNGSSAQQQLIAQCHQAILHVPLQLGNQLNARILPQLKSEFLRYIASVAKHFAKESLQELGHRRTVISRLLAKVVAGVLWGLNKSDR